MHIIGYKFTAYLVLPIQGSIKYGAINIHASCMQNASLWNFGESIMQNASLWNFGTLVNLLC